MSSKTGVDSRAADDESWTSVKVVVRVRPPLKPSDPGYDLIPQRLQRSMVQTTSNTSLTIDSPQGRKMFVFDRIFSPEVMQDGIWEYLEDSIDSFTQGYNVSLLAYGQSGAGKSYTMGTASLKKQDGEAMIGVIPRAATALFEKLDMPGKGSNSFSSERLSTPNLRSSRTYSQQSLFGNRNWSLKASYVEIYNEQLRDLLLPDSTPTHERRDIAIREHNGNFILTGLRQVDINSVDDLMNTLHFGSNVRQTDATTINAKSSRSHAVFSLNLVQRKNKIQSSTVTEKRFSTPLITMAGQDMGVTTDSKLHFVNLAGSERLKNTGAQGERAKEGISINAGLASLGKVISQLSSRQSGSHVSFRDSKLTRLLQDSLGGNSFTYMIACVTPAEFYLSETLNTVQYAQRARAIQSKPRLKQVDEGDSKALVGRLRAEVNLLRDQIRSSQGNTDSPRRSHGGPNERSERCKDRESELQNQLIDLQKNYSALSQRYTRLITQLHKAREHESAQTDQNEHSSADDRLNRTTSFAPAGAHVVLEYETTIQSLEQSLSSTRTTLSDTATLLLEKETNCAFLEDMNSKLQSRLQKLMDREARSETYLHELNAKLDGHTSAKEKNANALELRKEIVRVRENKKVREDYISTLMKERLSGADEDSELMQHEVKRLELVVERLRSLGNPDALLYELDHVDDGKQQEPEPMKNGTVCGRSFIGHTQSQSHVNRRSQFNGPIPEPDEHDEHAHIQSAEDEQGEIEAGDSFEDDDRVAERKVGVAEAEQITKGNSHPYTIADERKPVTKAQVDLRVERGSTVQDFDQLQARYEEALRIISEQRDAVDEACHQQSKERSSVTSHSTASQTPQDSVVSDRKSIDVKDKPRSSMSRSLSAEVSPEMESSAAVDASTVDLSSKDRITTTKDLVSSEEGVHQVDNEQISAEFDKRRKLAEERDTAEETKDQVPELIVINDLVLGDIEAAKTPLTEAVSGGPEAVPASMPEQPAAVKNQLTELEVWNEDRYFVEELERQLQNNVYDAQMTKICFSTPQPERNAQLEVVSAARSWPQADLDGIREGYTSLRVNYRHLSSTSEVKRSNHNSIIRQSASYTCLPSPPPVDSPLPLPNVATLSGHIANDAPIAPIASQPLKTHNAHTPQPTEDQEARIRTIEKHLYAERQLTKSLEEALTDLEKQSKKIKCDCDSWKRHAQDLETELKELKGQSQHKPQPDNRWNMQAVEEERKKRQAAEAARKQLEERMDAINKGKKKKARLSCF